MKEVKYGEVIIVGCYIKLLRIEVLMLMSNVLQYENTRRRSNVELGLIFDTNVVKTFRIVNVECLRMEKWNDGHVPNGTLANV